MRYWDAAMTEPPPGSLRRFAARLIGFLALSACVFAAAEGVAIALTVDPAAAKFEELFRGTTDWEGLVVGTSRAQNGIAPAFLDRSGGRWYNFAVQGAPPDYFAALWALYRATGRKPKRLIYAADPFVLDGSLDRQLEHDAAWLPLDVYLRWLLEPARNQALLVPNRFRIYTARPNILRTVAHARAPAHARPDLGQVDRGFVPLQATTPPHTWPIYRDVKIARPELERRFEAMLRGWQAEGIAIALVQTPEYAPLAGNLADVNAALARLATRLGVPFLDYNGPLRPALAADPANFVDHGHLSAQGAAAFGPRLAADLAQNWK